MKPILFFPDYYCDNSGNVFSIKSNKLKQLKCRIHQNGYCWVSLRLNNKTHYRLVHRLIWETYYGPIPNHFEIDHIDRDKHNNSLSNLRLATKSQQQQNKVSKNYHYLKSANVWIVRFTEKGKVLYYSSHKAEAEAQAVADAIRQTIKPFYTTGKSFTLV